MQENELFGRVEALATFVLQLAAELEMAGVIDGPKFSQRLRGVDRMEDQDEIVQLGRERLSHMLDTLDAARAHRAEFSPRGVDR